MNNDMNDHDSFERELRASAADVLRRCDSDVAPGVVRTIRERSIQESAREDLHGAIRGWFGWREAVGVAAAVALAAGVWWSGFESGRVTRENEIAQGQAVVRTLPFVGDRAGGSLRGVLASADNIYSQHADELGDVTQKVARRVVDGMLVPGLWDKLTAKSGGDDAADESE
jgi:hypothetical protein